MAGTGADAGGSVMGQAGEGETEGGQRGVEG